MDYLNISVRHYTLSSMFCSLQILDTSDCRFYLFSEYASFEDQGALARLAGRFISKHKIALNLQSEINDETVHSLISHGTHGSLYPYFLCFGDNAEIVLLYLGQSFYDTFRHV